MKFYVFELEIQYVLCSSQSLGTEVVGIHNYPTAFTIAHHFGGSNVNAVRKNIIPAMTAEVNEEQFMLFSFTHFHNHTAKNKCSKLPFLETTPELMKMSGENKIELVRTYYDKHSILSKNYIR